MARITRLGEVPRVLGGLSRFLRDVPGGLGGPVGLGVRQHGRPMVLAMVSGPNGGRGKQAT
jgi:hypothetical protein